MPAPASQSSRPPELGFHLPALELRDLITSYYMLDSGDDATDDDLHPEWANIRFSPKGDWHWRLLGHEPVAKPGVALFGPTSRAAHITSTPGALMIGIGLLPLGWARLIGRPASDHADRVVPLADVWGPDADAIGAAVMADPDPAAWVPLFDALLLARVDNLPAPDPRLQRAHRVLVSGDITTVEAFAAEVGVTGRTLERLCARVFGFGPKPLLRRQRFLRTLEMVLRGEGQPLSKLIDSSYTDQSHFVREFRAFMGTTPTEYLTRPRNLLRRAAAERRRVVGQGLQGLHLP
jgi:AraC-like DNA-binding protein